MLLRQRSHCGVLLARQKLQDLLDLAGFHLRIVRLETSIHRGVDEVFEDSGRRTEHGGEGLGALFTDPIVGVDAVR